MPFVGRTADSMTTEVLTRVRDANGVMHTAAFVRARLTDAQRYLNGLLGLVLGSSSLTLNPSQNFYVLTSAVPLSIRVVGVRGSSLTRDLAPAPSIDSFLIYGPTWMRQTAARSEAWTTVGRDVLVVYPAASFTQSLDVVYAKVTNVLAITTDVSEFSTEQCDLIVTLTEAILLLRQRDLQAAARAMDRLRRMVTPEMAAERLALAPTGLADKKGGAPA